MLCLCLGDCGGSPNGTEAVCNVLCAQVNTCPYPEYCTVEAKGGGRKHEKFYSWDLECAASTRIWGFFRLQPNARSIVSLNGKLSN